MIVETRDQIEAPATCLEESLPPALADFFDGFQAIRNKGRADDEQPFDAGGAEARQFMLGVRLHPGIAAQA